MISNSEVEIAREYFGALVCFGNQNGDNRIHFEEFWEFVLESIQHRAHEQAVAASKQVFLGVVKFS